MESIWTKTCSIPKREALQKDIKTEVAVIGAGMAGILIAYQLQKAGKQVVVLEANRIASGQTKNTTAKITSQHDLIYAKLIQSQGEEKARQYAMANEAAIAEYRRIIKEEDIHCDFQETYAYVYAQDKEKLMDEAEAAAFFGIQASFLSHTPLPGGSSPALRFDGQAQFHPLKFVKPLAEQLEIYEKTPVRTVDEHTLHTPKATVTAEHIVFATHYPFVNFPGLYFARMHQERSYVLALENAPLVEGMFIGDGENAYSFRIYEKYLLFGGEGHRTGENRHGGKYDALRKKAKELFPQSLEAAHWSAQDCIPADGIPYIGQYASGKPYWYVATGFQKWGMTTSMVSAMIIRDM
ncbi:MAG: NAD(P)/FAD-dependent oxidoreductase, partial [Anaerotignum sp.]